MSLSRRGERLPAVHSPLTASPYGLRERTFAGGTAIRLGDDPYEAIMSRIPFPRSPIALSEVTTIDDDVLAATVASLREMVEVNAGAGREPKRAGALAG